MAKLTDFKTPTGVSGNILDPKVWLQLIVGSAVAIIAFAMGQNLANTVGGRAKFIDSQIDKPYRDPVPQTGKKIEVI